MKAMDQIVLMCMLLETVCVIATGRYNYDRNPSDMNGVYNWDKLYGSWCGGYAQSPVNIVTDEVSELSLECACPVITFTSPVVQGVLQNTGHSLTFIVGSGSGTVTLSDIPTARVDMNVQMSSGVFKLHNFHIHHGGLQGNPFPAWNGVGGRLSPGSEHMVNGIRHDGEVHLVFYNTKYSTFEDAMQEADGLTTLGFFVRVVPDSRWISSETRQLSEFLQTNIPRILEIDQNVTTFVDLGWFFNRRACDFYTYTGSITTPPCYQTTQWILFREPIEITDSAWYTLSGINYSDVYIRKYGNFRNIQNLEDRVVSTNVGSYGTCWPILPSV